MNDDDKKVISEVDRLGDEKGFFHWHAQSLIARREQS
jgi:hypothetical protein